MTHVIIVIEVYFIIVDHCAVIQMKLVRRLDEYDDLLMVFSISDGSYLSSLQNANEMHLRTFSIGISFSSVFLVFPF